MYIIASVVMYIIHKLLYIYLCIGKHNAYPQTLIPINEFLNIVEEAFSANDSCQNLKANLFLVTRTQSKGTFIQSRRRIIDIYRKHIYIYCL